MVVRFAENVEATMIEATLIKLMTDTEETDLTENMMRQVEALCLKP